MFRRAREARKKREAKEKRLFVINFVKRSTAKTVLFININPRVYTRNFNWERIILRSLHSNINRHFPYFEKYEYSS